MPHVPHIADEPAQTDSPAPADESSVAQLIRQAAELRAYATYYLQAQGDRFKLGLRRAAIAAVLGVFAAVALAAAVITAIVFVLDGLARGIGALLWGHLWAGYLIAGLLVLGGLTGALVFGLSRLTAQSKRRSIARYEQRRSRQRLRFQRDVEQLSR